MTEKHIYKTLKPLTFCLIPARSRTLTDGAGNISVGATTKGGKIVVKSGTFEVNEITDKNYPKHTGQQFTINT